MKKKTPSNITHAPWLWGLSYKGRRVIFRLCPVGSFFWHMSEVKPHTNTIYTHTHTHVHIHEETHASIKPIIKPKAITRDDHLALMLILKYKPGTIQQSCHFLAMWWNTVEERVQTFESDLIGVWSHAELMWPIFVFLVLCLQHRTIDCMLISLWVLEETPVYICPLMLVRKHCRFALFNLTKIKTSVKPWQKFPLLRTCKRLPSSHHCNKPFLHIGTTDYLPCNARAI